MSSRSKSLILALAWTCLLGGTAMAQPVTVKEVVVRPTAGGDVQTRAEAVSYADLDLGHEAGARALLMRIKSAAKRVCGSEPDPRVVDRSYSRCVDSALDRAVAEVNRPAVNALHARG